jgi:Ca-activated chloride channel family protein
VTRTIAGGLASLLLGLLAAAVAAGRGEVPPQKTPVFAVRLDVIEVTVTARDAKGELVSDLRADDFVLREDGREQEILIFAPAARPEQRDELALNLGMLFDTSQSMRENLRLSQESAIRFLDAIPRARDLLLIFFDRDIRVSRYSSENQQGIFGRILETQGQGYTALNDAIAVYLSRIVDTPGRKVLVVFTDGDDTTSRTSVTEVMRMLRSCTVTVYPVEFKGDRPAGSREAMRAHAFLADLADASGGRVFQPRASKELAEVYRSILDELGSQYVIGYVSDNTARDGRFRKITLEVKRPGLKLRYRPGYDAPKDLPPPSKKR